MAYPDQLYLFCGALVGPEKDAPPAFDGLYPPLERNIHPLPWLLMGLGGVVGMTAGAEDLTVEKVMSNPGLLKGMTPQEVEGWIGNAPGWRVETLAQGSKKGAGWVLREYLSNGQASGRMIRWHPGGSRHYASPHWTVTQPNVPTARVPGGQ